VAKRISVALTHPGLAGLLNGNKQTNTKPTETSDTHIILKSGATKSDPLAFIRSTKKGILESSPREIKIPKTKEEIEMSRNIDNKTTRQHDSMTAYHDIKKNTKQYNKKETIKTDNLKDSDRKVKVAIRVDKNRLIEVKKRAINSNMNVSEYITQEIKSRIGKLNDSLTARQHNSKSTSNNICVVTIYLPNNLYKDLKIKSAELGVFIQTAILDILNIMG